MSLDHSNRAYNVSSNQEDLNKFTPQPQSINNNQIQNNSQVQNNIVHNSSSQMENFILLVNQGYKELGFIDSVIIFT